MKPIIAVARLWYEANSFSPIPTKITHFETHEWVSGHAVRETFAGTASELGGVLRFAGLNPYYDFEFLHCCSAPPGGLVEDRSFTTIEALILEGFKNRHFDGVYLSLHGAMACDSDPTPELGFLKKVRSLIGSTPLGVSFDLHAHLSQEMLECIDAVSGYHTYPHTDMDETAIRVLRQLCRLIEGSPRPSIAIAKGTTILPSFNMRTSAGPMAEMQQLAKEWRQNPDILDVSVFGGFAYGDSPFAGPSVVITSIHEELSFKVSNLLMEELEKRRAQFLPNLPGPEEGLTQALATKGIGPAIVLDPADNPFSGGIGDTPSLFRVLLQSPRPSNSCFAFFYDPNLVALCHEKGVGASIETSLGGRITPLYGEPILIKATIERLTDGHFRNEGPMEHNMAMHVGRTVVLLVDGIKVIVTEKCQTPNDPAYFRLHGIDLATLDLLCVKAKNHFRAAFSKLARIMIDIDAPGPAAASLDSYRYRYVPDHVKPLTRSLLQLD